MIDDIEVFVKVVEQGSFSGAADSLAIPQSTVSRRIRHLEDQLGVRLLNRTTRHVKPTQTGLMYYQRCLRITKDLADANQEVMSSQNTPKGLLRITAPVESVYVFLDEIIDSYLKQYPDVEVDVVASNEILNPIDQGFDIAIRLAALKDSTLIARPLGTVSDLLCAAPAYINEFGLPNNLEALEDHKCLRMSNQEVFSKWELSQNKGTRSVSVSGPVIVNSLILLHKLTCRGHGIAKLPTYLCADNIKDGSLISILPEWAFPQRTLWVVYPSARHLSPNVRSFVDFLIEESKGYDFLKS